MEFVGSSNCIISYYTIKKNKDLNRIKKKPLSHQAYKTLIPTTNILKINKRTYLRHIKDLYKGRLQIRSS